MNIIEKAILKMIRHNVSELFRLENKLVNTDHAFKPNADSPEKSWPDPDKIPGGNEVPFSLKNIKHVGLRLKSSVNQGKIAIQSISDNPQEAKTEIRAEDLAAFKEIALNSGIGAIGYAKVPANLIFKDRAVLYDTAIVLLMEMDRVAITQAASLATFKMVMETYDVMGLVTNQLTDKLRELGYQAHASHPLGGLVLYPPLAVAAGLGFMGRHGLLISPQFGPRQRIAVIFVNINNLPINQGNEHSWIGDFCQTCGRCIKKCPNSAILSEPLKHKSGRKTQIIREKCLPVFVKQEGCTICVKECQFSNNSYQSLREKHANSSSNKRSS